MISPTGKRIGRRVSAGEATEQCNRHLYGHTASAGIKTESVGYVSIELRHKRTLRTVIATYDLA